MIRMAEPQPFATLLGTFVEEKVVRIVTQDQQPPQSAPLTNARFDQAPAWFGPALQAALQPVLQQHQQDMIAALNLLLLPNNAILQQQMNNLQLGAGVNQAAAPAPAPDA